MQGVTGPGGTAVRLRYRYGFEGEIAGKTGTTNNQADAWFIAYTPQIMAGAWVGCDDRYLRFGSQALGQGASAALPIWALFMKRVYADKSLDIVKDAKFKEPEGLMTAMCSTRPALTGALHTTKVVIMRRYHWTVADKEDKQCLVNASNHSSRPSLWNRYLTLNGNNPDLSLHEQQGKDH